MPLFLFLSRLSLRDPKKRKERYKDVNDRTITPERSGGEGNKKGRNKDDANRHTIMADASSAADDDKGTAGADENTSGPRQTKKKKKKNAEQTTSVANGDGTNHDVFVVAKRSTRLAFCDDEGGQKRISSTFFFYHFCLSTRFFGAGSVFASAISAHV